MPEDEKTEGPSQEKEQVEKETSNYLEMEDSFADLKYPDVLHAIAETNELNVPWRDLKEQIKAALLEQCAIMEKKTTSQEVLKTIDSVMTNILHSIEHHDGPPFTIQRLCELITDPRKHYRMFIKYLNAIEKVLSVTSTWNQFPEHTGSNGSMARRYSENDSLLPVQGLIDGAGDLEPIHFQQQDERNGSADLEN